MWYIKQDWEAQDAVVALAFLFVRPWLAMLALGGLASRLQIPALSQDYWTVWLAVFAVRMFMAGNPITKWKAAQTRKELK